MPDGRIGKKYNTTAGWTNRGYNLDEYKKAGRKMHHIHKGSCQLAKVPKKAINNILTIANAARFKKVGRTSKPGRTWALKPSHNQGMLSGKDKHQVLQQKGMATDEASSLQRVQEGAGTKRTQAQPNNLAV